MEVEVEVVCKISIVCMSVEVCVCPRTEGIFFIFILPLEYLILFHSILEENSFLILLSLRSQEIYLSDVWFTWFS